MCVPQTVSDSAIFVVDSAILAVFEAILGIIVFRLILRGLLLWNPNNEKKNNVADFAKKDGFSLLLNPLTIQKPSFFKTNSKMAFLF